jgi:hypothetical protein
VSGGSGPASPGAALCGENGTGGPPVPVFFWGVVLSSAVPVPVARGYVHAWIWGFARDGHKVGLYFRVESTRTARVRLWRGVLLLG